MFANKDTGLNQKSFVKILSSVSFCLVLLSTCFRGLVAASPVPLPNAHAHNDYEHSRPLLDGVDQGFCSVEADIHLIEGQLLVAHNVEDVKPERTLQALYLDPLLERARRYKGRIYPGGPEFTLLIDIKTEGEETYRALSKVLLDYQEMLTGMRTTGTFARRAVFVIISGNRPAEMIAADSPRLAGIDGRIDDLGTTMSPELMPLISDRWNRHFQWMGEGPFPEEEKLKLKKLVEKAHQSGRRFRLWAIPDKEDAWRELHAADVDLINTDDLAGLASFLNSVNH